MEAVFANGLPPSIIKERKIQLASEFNCPFPCHNIACTPDKFCQWKLNLLGFYSKWLEQLNQPKAEMNNEEYVS